MWGRLRRVWASNSGSQPAGDDTVSTASISSLPASWLAVSGLAEFPFAPPHPVRLEALPVPALVLLLRLRVKTALNRRSSPRPIDTGVATAATAATAMARAEAAAADALGRKRDRAPMAVPVARLRWVLGAAAAGVVEVEAARPWRRRITSRFETVHIEAEGAAVAGAPEGTQKGSGEGGTAAAAAAPRPPTLRRISVSMGMTADRGREGTSGVPDPDPTTDGVVLLRPVVRTRRDWEKGLVVQLPPSSSRRWSRGVWSLEKERVSRGGGDGGITTGRLDGEHMGGGEGLRDNIGF